MSYTPRTDEIKMAWCEFSGFELSYIAAEASFERWHAAEIRRAKAEAWDACQAAIVKTMLMHKDGDQFGTPVTIESLARYIDTGRNPYSEAAS